MKIKNSIRTIYIKIDNKREMLEDFIADDILKKFDESKNAEQIREIVALAAVNALCAFAVSEGIPADKINSDMRKKIAQTSAKVFKKINNKLQKQLKKKSKTYKNNNGENEK